MPCQRTWRECPSIRCAEWRQTPQPRCSSLGPCTLQISPTRLSSVPTLVELGVIDIVLTVRPKCRRPTPPHAPFTRANPHWPATCAFINVVCRSSRRPSTFRRFGRPSSRSSALSSPAARPAPNLPRTPAHSCPLLPLPRQDGGHARSEAGRVWLSRKTGYAPSSLAVNSFVGTPRANRPCTSLSIACLQPTACA